jgi:hypothetical protein
MYYLMGKKDTIKDLTSFYITCMFIRYERREEEFEVIGNGFGDDHIHHIVEGNRPEFTGSLECSIFWIRVRKVAFSAGRTLVNLRESSTRSQTSCFTMGQHEWKKFVVNPYGLGYFSLGTSITSISIYSIGKG